MNISPIINQHFNVEKKQNITKTSNSLYRMPCDSVSFGSLKSIKACQLVEEAVDKIIVDGSVKNHKKSLISLMREALPSIMTEENKLGRGRDSTTYRIGYKYIAKVKNGCTLEKASKKCNKINIPKRKFSHLDSYYGETQLRVGDIEILKNASPNEADFNCGYCSFSKKVTSKTENICDPKESYKLEKKLLKDIYEDNVLSINKLPQESFDRLAENLSDLNKESCGRMTILRRKPPKYMYDKKFQWRNLFKFEKIEIKGIGRKHFYVPDIINPNNFIVSGDEIRMVDDFRKVPCKNPNTIWTMLTPIMLKINPENWASPNPDLIEQRKSIFKKILIAAEKKQLPLVTKSRQDGEYAKSTLNHLLGDSDKPYGIGTDVISKMREMRKQGIPLEERLKRLEENFEEWTDVKKHEENKKLNLRAFQKCC